MFGAIPADVREIEIPLTGAALIFSFIFEGLERVLERGGLSVWQNRAALAVEIRVLVHG